MKPNRVPISELTRPVMYRNTVERPIKVPENLKLNHPTLVDRLSPWCYASFTKIWVTYDRMNYERSTRVTKP